VQASSVAILRFMSVILGVDRQSTVMFLSLMTCA